VIYDPAASCPLWDTFLSRTMGGNANLISFLQRAAGYTLTGDVREQCLFFLHGTGANGKSTYLEVLRALLGDYAKQADFSTFIVRTSDGVRNDLADLRGARLVTATEVDAGKRFAESLVKQLTGGDTIKARFLFQEFFEFEPTFKLFLAANHKPRIEGTDYAIWRRIRLIPFTVTIPEAERDPDLKRKLLGELPGILRWAVEGCLEWQKRGLKPPEEVLAATEDYRAEMDSLTSFFSESCVIHPESKVLSTVLYDEYVKWCGDSGEEQLPRKQFVARLREKGFGHYRGAGGRYYWYGVTLKGIPAPVSLELMVREAA